MDDEIPATPDVTLTFGTPPPPLDMVTEGICPACGGECGRDEVDVLAGYPSLKGPWGCPCGWSEDSAYDVRGDLAIYTVPHGYLKDSRGCLSPPGRLFDDATRTDPTVHQMRRAGLPPESIIHRLVAEKKALLKQLQDKPPEHRIVLENPDPALLEKIRERTTGSPVELQKGDYVLATKYSDGDPQDHWVLGFYAGVLGNYQPPRHEVLDSVGNPFRGNGFRRVEKVSVDVGLYLATNRVDIEIGGGSIWDIVESLKQTPPTPPDVQL